MTSCFVCFQETLTTDFQIFSWGVSVRGPSRFICTGDDLPLCGGCELTVREKSSAGSGGKVPDLPKTSADVKMAQLGQP